MCFLHKCIYISVAISTFLVSLFSDRSGWTEQPAWIFLLLITVRIDSCHGNSCHMNDNNASFQGLMVLERGSETLEFYTTVSRFAVCMWRINDPCSGLDTLEWMLREGQRVQACHRHLARPWPEWAGRYLESHFININLASWSESICVIQLDILFSNAKGTQNCLIQGLVSLLEFKIFIKSLFCTGYFLQLERFLEVFSGNFLVLPLNFNPEQNWEKSWGRNTKQ